MTTPVKSVRSLPAAPEELMIDEPHQARTVGYLPLIDEAANALSPGFVPRPAVDTPTPQPHPRISPRLEISILGCRHTPVPLPPATGRRHAPPLPNIASPGTTSPGVTLIRAGADRLRVTSMETLVYYFTGTGNSLAVASGLCERLGDCRCVPIASLRGDTGPVRPGTDRVGIVCPVYFQGLPLVVAEVAGRLDLEGVGYVFAVCTMGGSGGAATLHQLDVVLKTGTAGRGLDAGFAVRMPGNYILKYGPPGEEAQQRIVADAERQVDRVAEAVARGERTILRLSPFASLAHRVAYPRFIAKVHDADRQFTVDERCTSCGTCARVCPVENIRLDGGRPVWLHRCEQCLACIQVCPTEAIQAGKKTEGRGRYRHPGVTIAALAGRDRLAGEPGEGPGGPDPSRPAPER